MSETREQNTAKIASVAYLSEVLSVVDFTATEAFGLRTELHPEWEPSDSAPPPPIFTVTNKLYGFREANRMEFSRGGADPILLYNRYCEILEEAGLPNNASDTERMAELLEIAVREPLVLHGDDERTDQREQLVGFLHRIGALATTTSDVIVTMSPGLAIAGENGSVAQDTVERSFNISWVPLDPSFFTS